MPTLLPLLFDLDGTLVDSLPDIAASVNHVRLHHGMAEANIAEVRVMLGDGLQILVERALAKPGAAAAAETVDEAIRRYRSHHREQCTQLVQPYPGVRDGLERYRALGHPLAVVTNKPEEFAWTILRHLELDRLLPVVVGGDTTPHHKPHGAPVWAALEQLGLPQDLGLMIGDSLNDVAAGQAAGIRTAAVLYGYGFEGELRAAKADEYWTRFGDGPASICDEA